MKKLYAILAVTFLIIAATGLFFSSKNNNEEITGHTTFESLFERLFTINPQTEATNIALPNRDAEVVDGNINGLPEDNDASIDNNQAFPNDNEAPGEEEGNDAEMDMPDNNPDLPGDFPEELKKCKILNTAGINPITTLNQICQENGLTCKGVESFKITKYFDNDGKLQVEEKNYKWLAESPNCASNLNPVTQDSVRPINIYAEPYAGPIYEEVKSTAVLCC